MKLYYIICIITCLYNGQIITMNTGSANSSNNSSKNNSDNTFAALVDIHRYPIRLYPRVSATAAKKKRFCYKKDGNGKEGACFFIYTAAKCSKEVRFENYEYCLFRLAMHNIALHYTEKAVLDHVIITWREAPTVLEKQNSRLGSLRKKLDVYDRLDEDDKDDTLKTKESAIRGQYNRIIENIANLKQFIPYLRAYVSLKEKETGTQNHYSIDYKHYCLTQREERMCTDTLKKFVSILSLDDEARIVVIGPYTINNYSLSMLTTNNKRVDCRKDCLLGTVIKNGDNGGVSEVDENVVKDATKHMRKELFSCDKKIEWHEYVYSNDDIDELLTRWPDHDTKVELEEIMTHKLEFGYTDSPGSSPEASEKKVYDLTMRSVSNQSKTYKLQ